jgi:uncharacterized OB-fold protein
MAEKVIPLHMIPDQLSEVVEKAGERFLQCNEAMFTFYKRSKGEFSKFFLSIQEKKVILGAKCPECGLVRVPPFVECCPDCDFAELESVEMPDVGVMNSTPPITYFAHSLFAHMVPFGRGRVILDGADTAMPIQVYTTKGVLTPRVFSRGTKVKVVFRSERLGRPTDMFAVPLDELTPQQQAKKGLEESELDFSSPIEPEIPQGDTAAREATAATVARLKKVAPNVEQSPRASKDLKDWRRRIAVKTSGGSFGLVIDDGKLEVSDAEPSSPDLVMVTEKASLLDDWLDAKESLTNAIIKDILWISVNKELTTIFKLDRLPRSLRRT